MTISIGSIKLNSKVILAPMSGVTDMPYRRLAKSQGAGLVISEMIASRAMIYENKRTLTNDSGNTGGNYEYENVGSDLAVGV